VKGIRFFTLGFFIWALIPGGAWAAPDEVIEAVGNGVINWSQGIILAKGGGSPPKDSRNIAQARLMTERAALTDARRNLLEVLKGVRVDSMTRVENFMTKDDQIRLQADGFIQGSVEVRRLRKYLSDGAIEVTVAIDLAGDFISLMQSAAVEARKGISPPSPPPAPALEPKIEKKPLLPEPSPALKEVKPSPLPPPVQPPEKKPGPPPSPLPAPPPEKRTEPPAPLVVPGPEKKPEPLPLAKAIEKPLPALADLPPFTGAVIDARGLKMKPALVIRILDEGGQELYRGQYVPREKASQQGLALFSRDLTAAQTNPRVGKNPLTLKGAKADPANPSDIVLAKETAQKLAPFAQKGTFLEDCRVMVVLD
jgi:hypothetical protein